MEKRGDVGSHTPSDKPCCGGRCQSMTKKSELQVQKDLLDKAAEPKKS